MSVPVIAGQRRWRRWVPFFLVLVALGAVAVVVPIVYNLRLQLRPEQLEQARQRWREQGPPDYDLSCERKTTEAREREPTTEEAFLRVRGGRVVRAVLDGEVFVWGDGPALILGPGARALAAADVREWTVEGLFDRIEANLKGDAGTRNYAVAYFDSRDGHTTRYIRRVRGSREREEWNVRLTRPGEKGGRP
jgi:hypothetical protein